VRNGSGFVWSSDDVKAGIEAVRNAMHIIDGKTELLVMREKVPKLCWEMDRYSYRKLPGGVVTDEPIKLNDHLVDNVRYLCMARLKYVKPRAGKRQGNYVNDYLKQKKERERHRKMKDRGHGGSVKVW
jgi:hypothetical protein